MRRSGERSSVRFRKNKFHEACQEPVLLRLILQKPLFHQTTIFMKSILIALLMMTGLSLGMNAQTTAKASSSKPKKHVCTEACKDGKHVYACGEKGHVCTDACHAGSTAAAPQEMKEHVCTSACQNGQHVYACGEKGHVCTEACHAGQTNAAPMELKEHVCTDACKNGQHVYACGEKGHVCTDACKKKE